MTSQGRLPTVGSAGSITRASSQASQEHSCWTDDLPVCHLSGVGFSTNQIYREDGLRREEHEFEDRSFHFRQEEDPVYLYGVFDGHDGSRVSDFAAQRMPAELLLGQLAGCRTDIDVKDVLRQAFVSVEKGFFETIDDVLAEKTNLRLQLPEGLSAYEAYNQCPDLYRLDNAIAGGTTAVVAVIVHNKLFVANVGCCRALLCKADVNGTLRVMQLTVDHHLNNDAEILRLAKLGVDVARLQKLGQLGRHQYTRAIGDYSVKAGYKELEMLSSAWSEPVIADPEMIGGIEIDSNCSFLLLMSDGLYKSLEEATDTEHVNADIVSMVAHEFAEQSTLNGVAQAVVDKVVRRHHDKFMLSADPVTKELCQKRDDITLLVRNFNYPLPNAIASPTGGMGVMSGSSPNYTSPLSVIIPGSDNMSMTPSPKLVPATRPVFTMTNTSTLSSSSMRSITNSNSSDSSSGDHRANLFASRSITKPALPLDRDGRVEPYIDFSGYYKAIAEMTENQKDSFVADMEPRAKYESIAEDGE
ncbi:hypothetical protein NP493_440g03014 [Ridgeia piscesae]|uniref:TGF-beta-activated kinase 1 and MAP3K7-binding protein 1 n=1 Tax=Ridgeia piscesae TaxID=27915 RepID=A0AAD9KZL6_RIDPI|nr:hypothetical protein NP493_440g03014 [Ridgeia piscesae]